MSDSFDIELAAAELRADAADTETLVNALGTWLEGAVPHLVEVERKRAGLRDSRKLVTRIRCQLGDETFIVERHGRNAEARRAKTVRGITLKSESLTLGELVTQLTSALARHAEITSASFGALRDLLA